MRIPLPRMPQWLDRWLDWANIPLYKRGRLEVRHVDVLLVFFGIVCVSWYAYTSGWQGALMGASIYVLMTMLALWFF